MKKCKEYFTFSISFSYDRLCIYIHTLQYQCNSILNCNEQNKERIGHDNNILRESNHNKSEHNINHISNIDSNYYKRYYF